MRIQTFTDLFSSKICKIRRLKKSEIGKNEEEAGPTGIEPAAYGLRVRRSSLTELRAHRSFFQKGISSANIEVSLTAVNIPSKLLVLYSLLYRGEKTDKPLNRKRRHNEAALEVNWNWQLLNAKANLKRKAA